MAVCAGANRTNVSIALVANMSPGTSPDCTNCDTLPILMSFTIQSPAPPDVPHFAIPKRRILNTSVCGRPVICADCVGRIGTPVDIGRMSRFACVGTGASTTAARGGNANPIGGPRGGPKSAPTHPDVAGGAPLGAPV